MKKKARNSRNYRGVCVNHKINKLLFIGKGRCSRRDTPLFCCGEFVELSYSSRIIRVRGDSRAMPVNNFPGCYLEIIRHLRIVRHFLFMEIIWKLNGVSYFMPQSFKAIFFHINGVGVGIVKSGYMMVNRLIAVV